MDYNRLAELLFPHINTTPEEMEARYPKRELPEGAKVTRMGPSPTGFMHLGNLYGALVDERLAHQSKGVFYLRIEDTDRKREVEGGVQMIIDAFKSFGLPFDEGATTDGETGIYGPYRQSQRAEIYQTFVKSLVQRGMDALMEGRTVFVIAHRLSTIQNADVVMVLDHGRIIERGNHDQLMAEHGTYYQLYTGAFELE